jgi:glycosyltransferase involved in cell wall biosynthesis
MRNLLIISFFHSSQHHVGSIRTQRFAHYLPKFGWRPYVLTRVPTAGNNGQSVKEPDDTFYVPTIPLNKPFHLESLIWVPFMLRKAVEILRKTPIEVVLISCPPFYQAIAGVVLKKRFGSNLVIDYRDAWGLNPYRQRLGSLKRTILQGEKLIENLVLRNTDLLIVSHQEMKDRYLRRFNFLQGRTEVIYNGFDPERIASHQDVMFSEFTILHLGDFYAKQGTRDPDLFLSSLQMAITERRIPPERLRVLFIGERYKKLEEMIINKGLSAYVSYLDRVSHDVAMEYLNKSHAFLLIETLDVMTTKVYEYLATGKPMLCLIKQGGELEAFIRRFSTNASILPNDVDQIKETIWSFFSSYQEGLYRLTVSEQFRNQFTRLEQTRCLAEILDRMGTTGSPYLYQEVVS